MAYVYNALKDLTLLHNGREHKFLKGRVTEVDDQVFTAPDVYRRNHPSNPQADAMLEARMNGGDFARMILNRHYLNLLDAGCWVGDEKPTDVQKQACALKAEAYKRKRIDEALQERSERRAGGKGLLALDEEIIEWMRELGITDELYNPAANEERLAKLMAEAIGNALANAQKPQPVATK